MWGGILNKNAFTLIELLAIIVILAIIAVITVPIILNIIENSKKGAVTDSAYGYKDAVSKAYVTELSKPNQEGLKLNGTYEVQSDGTLVPADGYSFGVTNYNTLPVSVSGEKPTSGTLIYDNNILTSGTLVIGDYTATYSNGSFTAVKTSVTSSEQGGTTPTYTYYVYGLFSENPIISSPNGYDLDYSDYETPSNNNECSESYAYYEGDASNAAGCYWIYGGLCDNGEYNYETGMCHYCQNSNDWFNDETGKCEYEGYREIQEVSNRTAYLRNDGTIYEPCGVFGSGQAGTVCLTSYYYDYVNSMSDNPISDYPSVKPSDFADVSDVTENITTISGLSDTGLKGYSLAKGQEMLTKGASYCEVSEYYLNCYMTSGDYCYIDHDGGVACYEYHDEDQYSYFVRRDGVNNLGM